MKEHDITTADLINIHVCTPAAQTFNDLFIGERNIELPAGCNFTKYAIRKCADELPIIWLAMRICPRNEVHKMVGRILYRQFVRDDMLHADNHHLPFVLLLDVLNNPGKAYYQLDSIYEQFRGIQADKYNYNSLTSAYNFCCALRYLFPYFSYDSQWFDDHLSIVVNAYALSIDAAVDKCCRSAYYAAIKNKKEVKVGRAEEKKEYRKINLDTGNLILNNLDYAKKKLRRLSNSGEWR